MNVIELLATRDRIELDSSSNIPTEVIHRAMGALLGAACADALGAPFEFGPAGRYTERFPSDVRSGTGEMIGGGSFDWLPGEFTDDSQMMLALAESLCSHNALDLDDLWHHFTHWQGGATDCGLTTASALRHETWRGAAERAHSAGAKSASNGALMRVWPIAVAFHDAESTTCMAAALAQARATHFHPLAGWSAAIGAEMCRRAINGHDPLQELAQIVALVPEDLQDQFRAVLHESWDPNSENTADNGTALICLAQAVWAVRHGSDFAHVVRLAVDLGGDTDTVACVAGAIAGARASVQGIPGRWLAYVNGSVALPNGTRKEYRYRELLDVARALLGLRPSHLTATERPAHPRRVDDHHEIYASDLAGAIESSEEFAVISLCLIDR
ncbi:MAG: ADP-ribosylglycohydrolase family protein, partial [Chloroflexota bacterium]